MRVKVPTIALLLALSGPLRAGDWPQWRGPLGNGVSPEKSLPVAWAAEGAAWRAPLRGVGVSTPVVAGDRVYVTSQKGTATRHSGNHPKLARGDAELALRERALGSGAAAEEPLALVVEAFAASDGRRLWEHSLALEGEHAPLHEKHNLASPSVVSDGERVYAWFGSGQLVALTSEGRPLWQRHLGKELGAFELQWGHASSPVLHGELLYLLCYHEPAARLLAVDKRSGETRWTLDRGKNVRSYATPVVVRGGQGEELIVNSTSGIDAYDPATGRPLWRALGEHSFAVPSPAFQDGVVYASRGYRSGPFVAILTGGQGDVSESHVRWTVDAGAPYVSSLVAYEGLLYMASDAGVVSCVDAASGQRLWQERVGGIFSASPVAGDGKVYFASETGDVLVFAAGREPRLLSRNRVEGRLVASPAIAGGRLFFRTDDQLVAIGP